MRSRMAHFVADMFEPVGAAEGPVILLRRAFRRKPVGALPSELLSEDGTEILQPVIAGRGAKRTRSPALFIRIVDDDCLLYTSDAADDP